MPTNENLNNSAIHKFKNSLSNYEYYGSMGFQKECLISYNSQHLDNKKEVLNVRFILNGANPSINIDVENEGKIITSELYHLDFEPRFSNEIRFNEIDKILEIKGNSLKMGTYFLTFTPLE